MDLLGGYSSDSSDESGNSRAATNDLPSASSTTPTHNQSHITSQSKATVSSSSQVSHRGKKLLKLEAVLPPHVWQRLTKSSQQDSDNDDSDNDDEGDNAKIASNIHPVGENHQQQESYRSPSLPLTRKSLVSGPTKSTSTSTPLASLLLALPKAKSSTSTSLVSPGIGILGSTLLSTGNSSFTRNDDQSIGGSQPIQESQPNHEPMRKDEIAKNANQTMDPGDSDGESDGGPPRATKDTNTTVPRPRTIPNPPPRPAAALLPSGMRGLSMTRTAAPTVRAAASVGVQPTPQQPSQQPPQQPTLSKKARRRQMEAMLRAGNVYNVESDIHVEGGGNTEFAQQQVASQAAAAAAAAASYQAHGVRVVPTSHYNVSTGTVAATTAISGKQRGKNQLNALLANAASLEASRLQNPQSSTNPQSTYRNNAKRKYGW